MDESQNELGKPALFERIFAKIAAIGAWFNQVFFSDQSDKDDSSDDPAADARKAQGIVVNNYWLH